MAVERDYRTWTVVAALDLDTAATMHKAVTVAGALSGSGNVAVGLVKSKGKTGEYVTVGVGGIMKAVAGAAITAGARLMSSTSGYILTNTSGTIGIGVALETAASGDLFAGHFDFAAGGTTLG